MCRAQFLSPDEAIDLVEKKKALLLDVREEYEFAEVRRLDRVSAITVLQTLNSDAGSVH
jgi:rhodanese-related sulfurtransferase